MNLKNSFKNKMLTEFVSRWIFELRKFQGFSLSEYYIYTDIEELIKNNVSEIFISGHPDLTLDIILKYPNRKWDWNQVSLNIKTPYFELEKHDFPWKTNFLKINKNQKPPNEKYNISFEYLVENSTKKWPWSLFSDKFSLEQILSEPNLPWNWEVLSSRNPNITQILDNIDKPWNFQEIALSENIDYNDFIEYNFLWKNVSRKRKTIIRICDVANYPNYNWNFYSLSLSNIRYSVLAQRFSWPLKFNVYNRWSTLKDCEDCDWNDIYKRFYIELIENGVWNSGPKKGESVDYGFLSDSNYLDYDYVLKNKDKKWNWVKIEQNFLSTLKKIYIPKEERRRLNAANKIKKWWEHLFWNPTTKVGIKHLSRMYEDENYSVW